MPFKAVHYTQVPEEDVKDFPGVKVRWLIRTKDGAENFFMRMFRVPPGTEIPEHSHDWEHEIFVLEGKGVVRCEGEEVEVEPGYVVFIPPNLKHSYKNTGDSDWRFLCLIPKKG